VLLRKHAGLAAVPHAATLTSKVFRRGGARELLRKKHPLRDVLAAGQWRSAGFLQYILMDDVEEEAIFEIVCARDEVEEELYSSSRKVKVVQELDPAQTSLGEFFGLSLGDDAPHGSIGSLDLSDIPSDLIEMVDAPPGEEAEIGIELDSESDDEILNRDRKSVTLVKERTGPFGSDPSPPLAVRGVKRGLRDTAQLEGEVVASPRGGLTSAAGIAPSARVPAPDSGA